MKTVTYNRCYTAGVLAASKSRKVKCMYESNNRKQAWEQGFNDLKEGKVKVNLDSSWSPVNE